MPVPDISRQIGGLIEVTGAIAAAYDSIKGLYSLPEAFQEVNKCLPLVEKTLQNAKSPAERLNPADDTMALASLLYSCKEKASKLREIFKQIDEMSEDHQYDSFLYREIIIKQGKQRVETLMDGILGDLGTLIAHSIFPAEMQSQVEPLAQARKELAKVSPSLADTDLADQPRTASQYGNNNCQYNLFGKGIQKITGGHYFEAKGDQNFGMMPEGVLRSTV